MTKALIEKQNKDLRLRLDNQRSKFDLLEVSYRDQIKKLQEEMGTMPAQILMLQQYIANCETEIIAKNNVIERLREENRRYREKEEQQAQIIKKLLARLRKNSSTSDKPSSTDVFVKPRTQSLRVKSGKKPGGQKGHTGHGPMLFETPSSIVDKMPEPCKNCGCDVIVDEKYAKRQCVDIEIKLIVTEERAYAGACPVCGAITRGQFSNSFRGPVQYGNNLKSFISLLNEYGCVSDSKTAEIVSSLCEDAISLSWGTIYNIRRKLSKELEDTINVIRAGLITGSVLGGDETGCRVNGKLNWVQIFCNECLALYTLNANRGDIDASIGILTYFTGILIHDHLSSYYKYKTLTHAECNEHILRILKSLTEIFKHKWLQDMSDLLRSACHEKKEILRHGKNKMPSELITAFTNKYDQILESGWAEYKASTMGSRKKESYYTEERRLLMRLGEYKEQHLLFINDFNAPFSNNISEQGIRTLKGKSKISGGFRSDEGAEYYARIMSLITTLRKQNKNVFDGIRSVFSGEVPISSSA